MPTRSPPASGPPLQSAPTPARSRSAASPPPTSRPDSAPRSTSSTRRMPAAVPRSSAPRSTPSSPRIGTTVKVYYAAKAFLSTEVARWMVDAGLNIDVCSGGELAVALAAGVEPGRIGFHGNNKSRTEIDDAIRVGVGTIVIDSPIEIERVAEAATRHGTRAERAPASEQRRARAHPRVPGHLARGPEVRHGLRGRPGRWSPRSAREPEPQLPRPALPHRLADLRRRRFRRSRPRGCSACTPNCSPTARCPNSTSAAASASPTPAPMTPARSTELAAGLADIVAAECARRGIPVPRDRHRTGPGHHRAAPA